MEELSEVGIVGYSQAGVQENRHGDVLVSFDLGRSKLDRRNRLSGRQARVLELRQELGRPAPRSEDGHIRLEVASVGREDSPDVVLVRERRVGAKEEGLSFAGDKGDAERAGEVDGGDDRVPRSGPAADSVLVCGARRRTSAH